MGKEPADPTKFDTRTGACFEATVASTRNQERGAEGTIECFNPVVRERLPCRAPDSPRRRCARGAPRHLDLSSAQTPVRAVPAAILRRPWGSATSKSGSDNGGPVCQCPGGLCASWPRQHNCSRTDNVTETPHLSTETLLDPLTLGLKPNTQFWLMAHTPGLSLQGLRNLLNPVVSPRASAGARTLTTRHEANHAAAHSLPAPD